MKTTEDIAQSLLQARDRNRDPIPVVIEDVSDVPRLRELEALQVLIWGNDNGTIVPAHLLQVIASTGGVVLGAFCDGRAVGFALGLLAQHRGQLYHASHMLGVHPGFQEAGIGALLKWQQRERALGRGLNMMTWTFDPLEARNAHFNLHKLGAAGRTYYEDYYGDMDDDLNRGLASDRLHVEWQLSPASQARERSTVPETTLWVVARGPNGPVLTLPGERPHGPVLIAAPENVQRLKREDMTQALAWRSAQREAFGWAFANGYMAHDFVDGTFVLIPDDGRGL